MESGSSRTCGEEWGKQANPSILTHQWRVVTETAWASGRWELERRRVWVWGQKPSVSWAPSCLVLEIISLKLGFTGLSSSPNTIFFRKSNFYVFHLVISGCLYMPGPKGTDTAPSLPHKGRWPCSRRWAMSSVLTLLGLPVTKCLTVHEDLWKGARLVPAYLLNKRLKRDLLGERRGDSIRQLEHDRNARDEKRWAMGGDRRERRGRQVPSHYYNLNLG